jgi:hypothetical protein
MGTINLLLSAKCASRPQTLCFATLLMSGCLPPHSAQSPSTPYHIHPQESGESLLPHQGVGTLDVPPLSCKVCHSVSTRTSAFPWCTEAQHSPPYLTMEESLPLVRAGTPDPILNGNLLLCGWHKEACFPKVHRGPVLFTAPAHLGERPTVC